MTFFCAGYQTVEVETYCSIVVVVVVEHFAVECFAVMEECYPIFSCV